MPAILTQHRRMTLPSILVLWCWWCVGSVQRQSLHTTGPQGLQMCADQQCCPEHKGHFSARALGMLKELGAWGEALQRALYGWAGACPVPFRGSSQNLLSAGPNPTVTAMSLQSWEYLLSHSTLPDQRWVVALVGL